MCGLGKLESREKKMWSDRWDFSFLCFCKGWKRFFGGLGFLFYFRVRGFYYVEYVREFLLVFLNMCLGESGWRCGWVCRSVVYFWKFSIE